MKILYLFLMALMPGFVLAQADTTKVPKEIVYQYKGEPFALDSGVSISDRQYQFLMRSYALKGIQNTVTSGIEKAPKIVYIEKPVRNKKDRLTWFLTGTAAGVLVTTIITVIVKK